MVPYNIYRWVIFTLLVDKKYGCGTVSKIFGGHMTKTTKLVSTLALLSLTLGTAMAGPRDTKIDKMFYSINPSIKLTGPVYKDDSSVEEKNKYGSEIVRLLIKKAHEQGKSYLEAGDYKAYNAILAMALTVPLQEALYIQFRNVEGTDACNYEANSGELVKKSSEGNYVLFNQYLKSYPTPFLPDCSEIRGDRMTQIIRGGDGTDMSLMQVSIRWHGDDFFANKKYENVEQTIEYGIGHLMKGFNAVYRNVKEYKCIASGGGWFFKRKPVVINYVNLIRGIWAGQYNSGSITKTCRFDEFNSDYKKHDAGFERNLNKILNFDGQNLTADLITTFKLDSDAAAAITEISNNIKYETTSTSAVRAVLNR